MAAKATSQADQSPSSPLSRIPAWQRLLAVPKQRLWQLNDVLGEIPVGRVAIALFAHPFARLHLAPRDDRISRQELRDAFYIQRVAEAALYDKEPDFGCQVCGDWNLYSGFSSRSRVFVYGNERCYECTKCYLLQKDLQGSEPSSSSGRT